METFSALLVTGEFHAQRPVTRNFHVSFYLRLIKSRQSKQSWVWWFGTPSCSLWRHCTGVCVSTVTWHCHKSISPWQGSFRIKSLWSCVKRLAWAPCLLRNTKIHWAQFTDKVSGSWNLSLGQLIAMGKYVHAWLYVLFRVVALATIFHFFSDHFTRIAVNMWLPHPQWINPEPPFTKWTDV